MAEAGSWTFSGNQTTNYRDYLHLKFGTQVFAPSGVHMNTTNDALIFDDASGLWLITAQVNFLLPATNPTTGLANPDPATGASVGAGFLTGSSLQFECAPDHQYCQIERSQASYTMVLSAVLPIPYPVLSPGNQLAVFAYSLSDSFGFDVSPISLQATKVG